MTHKWPFLDHFWSLLCQLHIVTFECEQTIEFKKFKYIRYPLHCADPREQTFSPQWASKFARKSRH